MKRLAFLFLAGVSFLCRAQTTAIIRLDFPPMPVDRVGIGVMQAEREPFRGTLTLEDGTSLEVTEGSIPPTLVRGHLTHYTVDACVGTASVGGGKMVIDLPPEPVRPRNGHMTALAITASVTVTLPNGQVGTGTVDFPDAPTRRVAPGRMVAAAVTATGSVTFP